MGVELAAALVDGVLIDLPRGVVPKCEIIGARKRLLPPFSK
jgi:hypothetical protein